MTIAAAFDRAADYDAHALVQARVAAMLGDRIMALSLPDRPRILEVGCGTGFLGRALIDRVCGATWLMTDLAPAMVARTAARFAGNPRVATAVMDGEHPTGDGRYELICSSLAVQWFADLGGALARLRNLLAPGGTFAFTTLVAGSFAEWRAAHDGRCGLRAFVTAEALAALGLEVEVRDLPVAFADGRAFVRGLKAIGAGTPRPGHVPLRVAALREVLARFEAGGAVATYRVATCVKHVA